MTSGYSAVAYSLTVAPRKRAMLTMPALSEYEKTESGDAMTVKLCCEAGFDKAGTCIAMAGIGTMGGSTSWGLPKDKTNKASCAMRATKDKKNGKCKR